MGPRLLLKKGMDANMRSFKRILVALSLSEGRDAAFDRALALAKTSGAELYLLHAVSANERFSYRAAERRRRSAELRERAQAAGVNAVAVEQHGNPAEIIVLHADARPVDLIVMGTGRRSAWARLRERSVAERVLRRTKRPTLVVSSDDTGNGGAFENVLVAVDLSPASGALVDTAARFSDGVRRQLTLVHAVELEVRCGDGIAGVAGVGGEDEVEALRVGRTAAEAVAGALVDGGAEGVRCVAGCVGGGHSFLTLAQRVTRRA